MLVFSGVFKNAQKNPEKICMSFNKRAVTYEEFVKNINERAMFLAAKYDAGSKIIIKNTDPIEAVTNFFSCSRAGIVSVPVADNINPPKLEKIKFKIRPCCIIDEQFYFELDENRNSILPDIDDSCIFLGALSSGTTGHNKIIWRDHKSWTSAFKYQSEAFNINSSDALFLVGSLSYTGNLNSAVHILNEGGSIVFSKSIYPRRWVKEIRQNNVTSIFMVPARYRILLKELKINLESVKSILSAGDKIDSNTVVLLKNRFPNSSICEYYGASELGHVSYINFRESDMTDSVGKAFPQVKLWIEKDVVWVESPYIAPDFKPRASVGDIGRIDKDGNLYILGRKNNTINKGGVKILPYNIEKVLDASPDILKSVVYGIKNSIKGEEICAVVVPKNNALTVEGVRRYCKNNLELYMQPKKIKIVKDIKLNSSGKIDRNLLL
ncbi:AMP-binding protein [Clostridium sp. LBM24168]